VRVHARAIEDVPVNLPESRLGGGRVAANEFPVFFEGIDPKGPGSMTAIMIVYLLNV